MKKKRVKSFELGSHTIKVIYRPCVVHSDGQEVMGMFIPLKNEIHVTTIYRGEALSEEVILHTFHHEKAHAKAILQNRWDLNEDEAYIDMSGLLDAQYEKTKKH